jgi:DNA polymerase I
MTRETQMPMFGNPPPLPAPAGWRPDEPPALRTRGIKEACVDLETTGLDWWNGARMVGAGVAWYDDERKAVESRWLPIRCAGGGNMDEGAFFRWAHAELPDLHLVNSNTRYDAHVALNDGLDFEGLGCVLGDVGHYAGLVDDRRRTFGLDDLAREYLGDQKTPGVDPVRIAREHASYGQVYGRQDASLAVRLARKLRETIVAEGMERVAALEDACIYPVIEMERNGCRLDVPKLREWVAESEQELLRVRMALNKAAGFSVCPDSPQDADRILRQGGHAEFTTTGANGFLCADDEVLYAAAARGDGAIKLFRRARKLASLRAKFLVKYLDTAGDTGILRYALHQMRADEGGAVSGRFASSALAKGVGANIQQVMDPSRQDDFSDWVVRALFVPEPGALFYDADAKQIEFRIFVGLTKSWRLLAEYGKDPNVSFHLIVGKIVEQCGAKVSYKQLKCVNFAKLYGAGRGKLAMMMRLDRARSDAFVDEYDRAFPESKEMLWKASDAAKRRGWVKTLSGRRARFPDGEHLHAALNRIIQGSAADIMKSKLVELHAERKRTGFKMRATLHDQVIGDVPDEASAALVTEILNRQSWPTRVPILWDAATGPNWAACA